MLEITDAAAGYGKRPVLDGVSLSLNPGEVVALVGPNGGGKSTLLKLALGHLRATSGRVNWGGKDVADWPRKMLARRVAYLPQSPTVLPGQRVVDVLMSGRSPYLGAFGVEGKRDRAAVETVAADLGLTDWLARDVTTLSGGQRQRVFVGRCVAQLAGDDGEPKAILLDEPDTFLDLRHVADLSTTIRTLAKTRGLGVLLASHDLNLAAAVADRLVLLHDGRVVAAGPPADVLRPAVVRAAYGVSVRLLDVDGRRVVVPEVDTD